MSQKELLTQIITKLRTDTGSGTLVGLTGHSSTDIRIARDSPAIKSKTPFLGVIIFQSQPALGSYVTNMQRAIVWFTIYSTDELKCIDIADRLEVLLHVPVPTNLTFYDFTAGLITNKMTRFISRTRQEKNEDTDVWNIVIKTSVIWINQPCV